MTFLLIYWHVTRNSVGLDWLSRPWPWFRFWLLPLEKLRQRAAEMIVSDNRIEARAFVHELLALTRKMPHLARGRADLEGHLGEIIDGSDIIRLAERELMTPLDQQARKLIGMAAT